MQISIPVFLSSALFVISCALPSAVKDEELAEKLKVLARVKRVIGGEEVGEGDWPYLVHLKGKIPSSGWSWLTRSYKYHYCGGALVGPRHVLTAAHCFDGGDKEKTPKHWHVKAGDVEAHTHFYDRPKTWLGRLVGRDDWITYTSHAKKITTHPEYDPNVLWEYDAAIIETEEEFPTEDDSVPQIGRVTLPPANTGSDWPADGQQCVMKGWGCTEDGEPTEDDARAVVLPKVSDSTCRNIYGTTTDSRFCAGYSMQDKGICSGDSGGPLVCKLNGNWTLAGIASFAALGAPGDHPAAFTRVTKIVRFVQDNIN